MTRKQGCSGDLTCRDLCRGVRQECTVVSFHEASIPARHPSVRYQKRSPEYPRSAHGASTGSNQKARHQNAWSGQCTRSVSTFTFSTRRVHVWNSPTFDTGSDFHTDLPSASTSNVRAEAGFSVFSSILGTPTVVRNATHFASRAYLTCASPLAGGWRKMECGTGRPSTLTFSPLLPVPLVENQF